MEETTRTIAEQVTNYLLTTHEQGDYVHFNVTPVTVTIGRITYQGARADRVVEILPGCRAWDEGRRHDLETIFYLVGTLPASYRRSQHTVYRMDGSALDWYLSAYFTGFTSPMNKWHPCGPFFMLDAWDVPDGTRIDQYARTPYRRMPIIVREQAASAA